MVLLEQQHHQQTQALPLERQGPVLALVLQPLVHNVLLNPLILLVESPLAKAAKEASPPRAKTRQRLRVFFFFVGHSGGYTSCSTSSTSSFS